MYTFAISFTVRRNRINKTIGNVFARITLNGQYTEIGLQGTVDPNLWQSKLDQFRGKSEEIQSLNNYVENIRYRITECYRQLDNTGELFDAYDVKELFEGKRKPRRAPAHSGHTFLEVIDYHNKENPDALKGGSLKNYRTTREYVARFIQFKFGRPDCFLTELNYQFITELRNHITSHPIKAYDPCTANGVAKHMERVAKLATLAKDKLKWIDLDPFEAFVNIRGKSKVIPLSLPEFKMLEKLDPFDQTLKLARDLFVFSTYTGLAYCDAMALGEEYLSFGENNKIWILSYREKSEEFFPVPMLSPAVALLNKYRSDPRSITRGKVFPYITNQTLNRSLKILGEITGITKEIHFHLARRLFGKEITLKQGVPITTVQKMMGHKKLSTTQGYADSDEEMIESNMEDLEQKMAKQTA